MYTKFYQNRRGFVEDMTETFWCFFRFTVLKAAFSLGFLAIVCDSYYFVICSHVIVTVIVSIIIFQLNTVTCLLSTKLLQCTGQWNAW